MSIPGPARGIDADRIVETIHEPLLVLDGDLRVLRANPSFCRTFDVSEEETVGRPLFELGDGQWDLPDLRDRLQRVVHQDTSFEGVEVDRNFPGLGRRVMRLNGRTLVREGGDSYQVLLAIDDVTEQRELEAKLRRQARELERSNADLEQFASAVSHDLREPLRMVERYLELLDRREGDRLGEDGREFLEFARAGARRMKEMIDGVLEYSRVGREQGEVAATPTGKALETAADHLQSRLEEAGADVSWDELPTVRADGEQLVRLFQNLLSNAIAYRGDEPPRVTVRASREGGRWRFAVEDNGAGIPPGRRSGSSSCSSGDRPPAETASASRSVGASSSVTAGRSGSSPSRGRDTPSTSPSRRRSRAGRTPLRDARGAARNQEVGSMASSTSRVRSHRSKPWRP